MVLAVFAVSLVLQGTELSLTQSTTLKAAEARVRGLVQPEVLELNRHEEQQAGQKHDANSHREPDR